MRLKLGISWFHLNRFVMCIGDFWRICVEKIGMNATTLGAYVSSSLTDIHGAVTQG